MGKTEWTEGPWSITEPDTFGDITVQQVGEPLAIAAVVNGELRKYGGKFDEHCANARLIASAPTMYEALEKIIEKRRAYDGEMGTLVEVFKAIDAAKPALLQANPNWKGQS